MLLNCLIKGTSNENLYNNGVWWYNIQIILGEIHLG